MSIYNENLLYFQKHAPVLHKILTEEDVVNNIEIEYDQHFEQYRMCFDNKKSYLNSAFDKGDEYFEMLRNTDADVEVLIIIGMGDGSIFEYLKNEKKKLKHLIIIEPYLDVFKLFLENTDIKLVFKDLGNISLVVNKNPTDATQLVFELLNGIAYKTNVISQISYYQVNPVYVQDISYQITVGFRTRLSSIATLNAMRNRWLLNTIYNFKLLEHRQEGLQKHLAGKPAIIVSAGPSLNKHLHLLEELKDKAIIVAAGSAIKILSNNNIKPHFRVAIDADGDEDLYDSKFYEEASEIPLLYSNQLNYGLLPKYEGHKVHMLLPTDLIARYYYSTNNIEEDLVSSGASVVQSALSFLAKSGCEPIVFIGQDMCFYEDNLYAKGRGMGEITRYNPHGLLKQKDIYGNDVFTPRNYLQIKYDYESLIKIYNNTMLNATEGGLGIEGVPNVTLQEVIDQYLTKDIELNLLDIIKTKLKDSDLKSEDVMKFIEKIYSEVQEILAIVRERRAKIVKLGKALKNNKNLEVRLSELFKLDEDYEKRLSQIGYYNNVVRGNIGAQVLSAKALLNRSYNKKSKEYIDSGVNYLHSITTEVEIFCELTKEWIEEVYSDTIPSIKEGENKDVE